jgi:hypothetical protein
VRQLVIAKLSLHDLACAATSCGEFRSAYLDRAAEERANLIAIVKDVGNPLFRTFTMGLQGAMFDSIFFPSLCSKRKKSEVFSVPLHSVVVTGISEPIYAATDRDASELECGNEPHAVFINTVSNPSDLFVARLYLRPFRDYQARLAYSGWFMWKGEDTNITLMVIINIRQAPSVLGFLLAAFRETPAASQPFSRCPLMISLLLCQESPGAGLVREAEDLVAPLRSVTESITIYRQYARARVPRGPPLKAEVVVEISKLRV